MSTLIGCRVDSCCMYLCACALVFESRFYCCCILPHGLRLFTLFISCDIYVFQLFFIHPQRIGVFGLVIANENFFELSMPYYFPLQWPHIFSMCVPLLEASCALYSNHGIV